MSDPTEADKARYSFYSALVFLVIASPFAYKLVDRLLGSIVKIADSAGHPTTTGLVVHTIVFGLIVYGMMHMNNI